MSQRQLGPQPHLGNLQFGLEPLHFDELNDTGPLAANLPASTLSSDSATFANLSGNAGVPIDRDRV